MLIMTDKWFVVERNVAICPKCNGGCALWKHINLAPTVYWLMCDYCDYEKIVLIEDEEEKRNAKI